MIGGIKLNVEIIVDGKSLELNEFVQKVTFEINSGLVNSLREVPSWTTIEIKLQK